MESTSFFSEQSPNFSFFENFSPELRHPPKIVQYSLFEGSPFADLLTGSPLAFGQRSIVPLIPATLPSPKETEFHFIPLRDSPLASPVVSGPALSLTTPSSSSSSGTPSFLPDSQSSSSLSNGTGNRSSPIGVIREFFAETETTDTFLDELVEKLPHLKKGEISAAKTILCWQRLSCKRKSCSYAHDPDELAPSRVNRKYKQQNCKREKNNQTCPYQYKCDFLHKDDTILWSGNSFIAMQENLIYRKGFIDESQDKR